MSKTILIDGSEPNVRLTCLANDSLDVVVLIQQSAQVKCTVIAEAHSTVRWHSAMLGGTVQCELVTELIGEGSASEHRGIFFGRAHDQFTLNYWNVHEATDTIGHITVHGVLFDSAYTDFKGNIKIKPQAHRTIASLTEHTLLLGDRARSDSIPQLEIETSQVQAAHSSGISRIDAEALFYCTSRGLTPQQAQQLIVRGFLAECISDPAIQAIVDERLNYLE